MFAVFLWIAFVFVAVRGNPLPASAIACERNVVEIKGDENSHVCSFSTDTPRPVLSWSVEHKQRDARQSAFRVIVYNRDAKNEIYWDSNKVYSSEAFTVYSGPPLKSFCSYRFTVQWWDHTGIVAPESNPGCFVTGALYNEWSASNAQWITAKSIKGAPFVRKYLTLQNKVKQAMLSISGLGYYRLFVNDREITGSSGPNASSVVGLRPGWTQYDYRCPYNTFDITHMTSGSEKLVVGVMLGLGWRNQKDYPNHDNLGKGEDERVLKAMLNITYEDGSMEMVVTDDTWLVYSSPITSDTIYAGETYNANLEIPHWSSPDYIPTGWEKADIAKGPAGVMDILEMPDIMDSMEEHPVKIHSVGSSQIVDFGSNAAGVCVLDVSSLKNTTVILHHAEVPLHMPYGPENGSLYYGNLRSAVSIDTYMAGSSSDIKTYKPSFTYHGFQYVEVKGFPRTLTTGDITRVRRNTQLATNPWKSSSSLINSIQEAVVSGQMSNLMSVPTDCPQRDERLGWMGDAGLSADSMVMNFQSGAFHKNFLKLIRDEQGPKGSIPDVVPFVHGGGRPADPSWSAALVQIVWSLWKYKNDTQTAMEFYPTITKYLAYMKNMIPSGGFGKYFARYGDWCPPPPVRRVNNSFSSTFSFLANINQTAELALALGKMDDHKAYLAEYEEYKGMFNKAFLGSNNEYVDGSQISYTLPLTLGAVPPDQAAAFIKNFINRINQDKVHVTSGIIGTKYLFPILTLLKYHDVAVEIAEQKDYPSYGYMLLNPYEPATSIWELWNSWDGNPGMDSRNHHMFSSVSGWFRTGLVGVEPVHGASLFTAVDLWPARLADIVHASTGFEYPHKLEFSWKQYPSRVCFKFPEHPSKGNRLLGDTKTYSLSCPNKNSVIEDILFASFGTPKGTCGHMATGECHVTGSEERVRRLCVGKKTCAVPVSQEYFGRDCSHYSTRWLHVDVQCSTADTYHDVEVNVTIPIGGSAVLHLPSHGARSMSVYDDGKLVWKDGSIGGKPDGLDTTKWEEKTDTLAIKLGSGRYHLTTKTSEPQKIISSYFNHSVAMMRCPTGMKVRKIFFSSFGNPLSNVREKTGPGFKLGWCHALTSRHVVEDLCMGKEECVVRLSEEEFGNLYCLESMSERPSLAVVYACSEPIA
jgi:alpha-L-rhamnosidase